MRARVVALRKREPVEICTSNLTSTQTWVVRMVALEVTVYHAFKFQLEMPLYTCTIAQTLDHQIRGARRSKIKISKKQSNISNKQSTKLLETRTLTTQLKL